MRMRALVHSCAHARSLACARTLAYMQAHTHAHIHSTFEELDCFWQLAHVVEYRYLVGQALGGWSELAGNGWTERIG